MRRLKERRQYLNNYRISKESSSVGLIDSLSSSIKGSGDLIAGTGKTVIGAAGRTVGKLTKQENWLQKGEYLIQTGKEQVLNSPTGKIAAGTLKLGIGTARKAEGFTRGNEEVITAGRKTTEEGMKHIKTGLSEMSSPIDPQALHIEISGKVSRLPETVRHDTAKADEFLAGRSEIGTPDKGAAYLTTKLERNLLHGKAEHEATIVPGTRFDVLAQDTYFEMGHRKIPISEVRTVYEKGTYKAEKPTELNSKESVTGKKPIKENVGYEEFSRLEGKGKGPIRETGAYTGLSLRDYSRAISPDYLRYGANRTPDRRDSILPSRPDYRIPDRRDSILPGRPDYPVPGRRGSIIPSRPDYRTPDRRDSTLPDRGGKKNIEDDVFPGITIPNMGMRGKPNLNNPTDKWKQTIKHHYVLDPMSFVLGKKRRR